MTSPWKLVGTTRTSGQPQTTKQRIRYYRQTLSNVGKISLTGSARLLNSCNIDSSIIFKNFSYFRLSEEKLLLPTTRYTRNLNFSVYIVNKVKLKREKRTAQSGLLNPDCQRSQGSEKSHICNAIARAIYNRGRKKERSLISPIIEELELYTLFSFRQSNHLFHFVTEIGCIFDLLPSL